MLVDMKKDLDSVFRRIRYDLLVLTYRYSFRTLLKITVIRVLTQIQSAISWHLLSEDMQLLCKYNYYNLTLYLLGVPKYGTYRFYSV